MSREGYPNGPYLYPCTAAAPDDVPQWVKTLHAAYRSAYAIMADMYGSDDDVSTFISYFLGAAEYVRAGDDLFVRVGGGHFRTRESTLATMSNRDERLTHQMVKFFGDIARVFKESHRAGEER